jgi:hypothetical protein
MNFNRIDLQILELFENSKEKPIVQPPLIMCLLIVVNCFRNPKKDECLLSKGDGSISCNEIMDSTRVLFQLVFHY